MLIQLNHLPGNDCGNRVFVHEIESILNAIFLFDSFLFRSMSGTEAFAKSDRSSVNRIDAIFRWDEPEIPVFQAGEGEHFWKSCGTAMLCRYISITKTSVLLSSTSWKDTCASLEIAPNTSTRETQVWRTNFILCRPRGTRISNVLTVVEIMTAAISAIHELHRDGWLLLNHHWPKVDTSSTGMSLVHSGTTDLFSTRSEFFGSSMVCGSQNKPIAATCHV